MNINCRQIFSLCLRIFLSAKILSVIQSFNGLSTTSISFKGACLFNKLDKNSSYRATTVFTSTHSLSTVKLARSNNNLLLVNQVMTSLEAYALHIGNPHCFDDFPDFILAALWVVSSNLIPTEYKILPS